jgi:hypothetical protein
MRQVQNPLRDQPSLQVIVATPHARYQLNEHNMSVSDITSILKGSNPVWSDMKPDGRTQYVSRVFDDKRGEEFNLVWQIENDGSIAISGLFIGRLAF